MPPPKEFGDKLAGGVATAVVMGLLGLGLIWGLAASQLPKAEPGLVALLDLRSPPPHRPRPQQALSRVRAGAASPANLRNKATPVVVPPAVVQPPAPPPPLVVAPKAGVGAAAQTGASDQPGPGQGAGGEGNGTGSGGSGDGDGAGYLAPRQLNRLKYGYLAPELRARGAQGTAEVLFHVTERGQVSSCEVRVSSGDRELDAGICQVIQAHLRFAPSRDPDGHPVGANVIATHGWIIDREDKPDPQD